MAGQVELVRRIAALELLCKKMLERIRRLQAMVRRLEEE